jgi:RNA polymerase sigma-70 factor (ECF subfamily)
VNREFALHFAGVFDLRRLKQHHFHFLLRHQPMLHPARNDDELAFPQCHAPVAKVHAETAAENDASFSPMSTFSMGRDYRTLSQSLFGRRYSIVNALGETAAAEIAGDTDFDLEALFRAHYRRIACVIVRVVRDPARAEELAVDVFLKLSRDRKGQRENPEGWLYRVAVRIGLDELRGQSRRLRYESLLGFFAGSPAPALTPEEIHANSEERERVRRVLGSMARPQAELLLLRSDGLSYGELASALHLNPSSVGTLLSRAQQTFRKEYIKRYGKQ